ETGVMVMVSEELVPHAMVLYEVGTLGSATILSDVAPEISVNAPPVLDCHWSEPKYPSETSSTESPIQISSVPLIVPPVGTITIIVSRWVLFNATPSLLTFTVEVK